MKKIGLCAIALLMAAFFAVQPNISWADASKLSAAGAVLQEIQGIPETEIPPQLFRNAHGIAIIPDLIKGSFIVGARYGKGVLAANFGGKWSAPVFITMGGTSVGLQLGAESTDIVLVFKTDRSIQAFRTGKFTLGADAAVAAGPVGRHAEASTDIELKAEIYAYSRSRGLFGGVALEGTVLSVDADENVAFYGRAVTADEILTGKVEAPPAAAGFMEVLERY
ncbi:MAG: lipid-binding SYLF domain-containing protein [Syntrophobacteraceae bacterium]|jgi:lipid-binding SYLF domain-containing protein